MNIQQATGRQSKGWQRILVMTAVAAEREAVLSGLGSDARFTVTAGGVGPVRAAVSTAWALAEAPYDLVISAGIGGGFAGRAAVGSLVVADEIVAADLGAETPAGFCSIEELGFGSNRIPVAANLLHQVVQGLLAARLPVQSGPVLTVSTVTGTAARAAELAARVPGAAAEAMEGYGVALAARDRGLPVLEIRTVSNLVGPRDRAAWRINEALDLLKKAGCVLAEVL
ncbi:futalosine hydrolase [Desulfotomaculum varum]